MGKGRSGLVAVNRQLRLLAALSISSGSTFIDLRNPSEWQPGGAPSRVALAQVSDPRGDPRHALL
eukprot:7495852-Pyramimonas_sp.AAC.1